MTKHLFLLLALSSILISIANATISPAEAPDDDFDECPYASSPRYYDFLEDCIHKMPEFCGQEVYGYIVDDKRITLDCCQALVTSLGYKCHIRMFKIILGFRELKGKEVELRVKTEQVWDLCVSAVTPESPEISPI